jgi:hypothetical protein
MWSRRMAWWSAWKLGRRSGRAQRQRDGTWQGGETVAKRPEIVNVVPGGGAARAILELGLLGATANLLAVHFERGPGGQWLAIARQLTIVPLA